jgi:hypothetical protein
MADTKLVKYDKAHQSLTVGLTALAERAKNLDITKEGVEFDIQKMVAQCQEAHEIARDRRDRELAPYVEPVTEIKSRWKPLIDGFDELFRKLKMLGGDVLRRKREEEEKKRREAEALLEEARRKEQERLAAEKRKQTVEEALAERDQSLTALGEARAAVDALPPRGAPLGVKTEAGTLFGREVWRWEVKDIESVPDAYCQKMVEGHKVDLAIKNGVREIAGIRIWKDVEMASRRAQKVRR